MNDTAAPHPLSPHPLSPHPLSRRLLGAVLAFIAPGAGHFFLGQSRLAVIWAGATLLGLLATEGAAAAGTPKAFAVCLVAMALAQAAAAADTLRRRSGAVRGIGATIGVALLSFAAFRAIPLACRAFVVEAFSVPSASMSPSIAPGDHLFVSKLDKAASPGRVIAYRNEDGEILLKRVIAVAGDTIETRESDVIVNGKPLPHARTAHPCELEEPCHLLSETVGTRTFEVAVADVPRSGAAETEPTTVVPGYVYVLGDARDWSKDSRMEGPIAVEHIVGTTSFVWLPLARYGKTP
jgi:signal peptidase I